MWAAGAPSGNLRTKRCPGQCAPGPRDRGRQPRLSAQRTPPGGGAGVEPGGGGNRRCRFDCGPLEAQEIKTVVKQLEAEGSPEGKATARSTGHGALTRGGGGPAGSEANLGETGRQPVAANASPPGRTLDCGARKAIVERDGEEQLLGENRALTSPGLQTPPVKSRKNPCGTDRVQSGEYLGKTTSCASKTAMAVVMQ